MFRPRIADTTFNVVIFVGRVLDTYKVGRVQDAVLHWVGEVQRELPGSSFFGLLQEEVLLGFDL